MLTSVDNVTIKRVSNILGETEVDVRTYFDNESAFKRVSHVTGIKSIRQFQSKSILSPFLQLGIKHFNTGRDKTDVTAVVAVTQTKEILLPNLSIMLAEQLGLSTDVICIDLPFGCSGFGNGLYQAALMANNTKGNVLLFLGDNITHFLGEDKTLLPIFGDAVSLVEVAYSDKDDDTVLFDIFTDGKGCNDIVMKGTIFDDTNNFQLSMNGTNVLTFAMSQAPKSLNRLIEHFGIDSNLVSGVYLHQANKFVVDKVSSRLKTIDKSLVHNDCSDTGNTGPASIPVLMEKIHGKGMLNGFALSCGFGVGWSVCSAFFKLDNIEIL